MKGKYNNLRIKSIKELKKQQAQERLAQRAKRSDEQQIAMLDKKFGVGKGAKKERQRLQNRIDKAKAEKDNPSDKKAQEAVQQAQKTTAEKHNKELAA